MMIFRGAFRPLVAFCIGVTCTTIYPALAASDAGPIKVIRTEIDAGYETRLLTAYRAYRDGDLTAAAAGYEDVLRTYPDNRDAMLGLAACALMQGEIATAAGMYRRILRAFPRDDLSRAALSGLQQDRQGEAFVRELLSKQPGKPFLYAILGQLQAAQARWPEARQAFAAAHRMDPTHPGYAMNLAISLDRMGQRAAALKYYRTTLTLVEQGNSSLALRPIMQRIQSLRRP
ncbi:MAG: tetratricopeptide repeat protein [Gammaproteobacteria bacterium]|nr:tetratricopeptide repeat protein [Gammaproteobacteria bacterium]MCY4339066.1 tetratricopeptide repeat protein [Gammaproteobacteria bacterium]